MLPYKVLIIDDQRGASSWGQVAKAELELHEFVVVHVDSWGMAEEAIAKADFDIIVIDLDLESPQDGLELLKVLRGRGHSQPIVLATGNSSYLDRPVRDYGEALASGPVVFYSKLEDVDFLSLVRESSNQVDSLKRALRLMREAGLGSAEFTVDGTEMTVDEILRSRPATDSLSRSLRESLNMLILQLAHSKDPRPEG